MNMGETPDLIIYHGPSCLDGFGCVWAANQKWPGVIVHQGVYGEPPPDVTGLRVLIADFSYPEEVLRDMAAKADWVAVLDHHETARAHVTKLLDENVIRGCFDLTRSGAALTWEYVWGNRNVPRLIAHLQDRDLWKFEMLDTREVCAVLASVGNDLDAWTGIARALETGRGNEVVSEGHAILRAADRDMGAVMDAGLRYMIIGGHTVPVVNAPYFWASEIGNRLAEGNKFAATYMDLSDRREFSLRSKHDGLEVHEIAKLYGGGGHPRASGFSAPLGWEGDIDQDEPPVDAIDLSAAGKVAVKEG